jgi:hypothetical protein
MMQESGDRRLTDRHFLLRQSGLALCQRDIRLLSHQLPDEFLVRRQRISLVPAEFGWADTARFAVQPAKAHDRADAHAKFFRCFRDGNAILLRHDHTCTQIVRIRLSHPMLASRPASNLNPIRSTRGIPPDSVFPGNALTTR